MTLPKAAALTLTLLALTRPCGADRRTQAEGAYASVNGLEMYYEVHGAGAPLVLLHGGGWTIESSFRAILPPLARSHKLLAIEQQAHGHTADIARPLSYEQMADDTAALLAQLGIERADFFGWSDGGNVALEIALRHPRLVRRLVVTGANFSNEGMRPGFAQSVAALTPDSPRLTAQHAEYRRTAPDASQWPRVVAKLKGLWLEFKGIAPEDLRKIDAPVLVMVGDRDAVRAEHALALFRLLPHASLAVLPATGHATMIERPEWVLSLTTAFLDTP
jgi:pimeloyl-ACP methyl ester carboxylesterase